MQPSTPAYPPTQPPVQVPVPGKTKGIVGFVFAFVGLQIPGLILSIIGYKQSKRAGHANTLALVGIILNSLGILAALIILPMMIATTLVSYNAISERANVSAAKAAATSIVKQTELHELNNDAYPTAFKDISNGADLTYITLATSELTSKPESASTIEFYSCGTEGNKIGYWDYKLEEVTYLYSGTASLSSSCTLSVQ